MNCPKCGSITENGVCNTCGKSVKEIYLKLYNEAQGKRDYDTALYYIEDLKKYAESEEELEEYIEIANKIEFVKMNESEMGQKAVKIKNMKKLGRLTRKERIKRGVTAIIILLILALLGVVIYKGYNKVIKNSDIIIDGKKLKTAIIINMSEPVSGDIEKKDQIYYAKIIDILRKHKDVKINISLSGTMLQTMNMYNSHTIEKIKEGIADGQFEIIGSTYSQNVIETSDIITNKWQISKDKELKKKIFGNEVNGFYNPQGIWGKLSLDLINKSKYKYTFIDDNKLEKVKSSYSTGKTGKFKNEEIVVFPFIKKGEVLFQEIINSKLENFEKEKELISVYRDIYEKENNSNSVAVLFIDWSKNELTDKKLENFEKAIILIEKKEWMESCKGSDLLKIVKSEYEVQNLLGNSEAEIGEINIEGYRNWYDLARESKKTTYYKELHKKYADFISKNLTSDNYSVVNLAKSAQTILLSSQYKFGSTEFLNGEKEFNLGKKDEISESIKSIEAIKDMIEGISDKRDRIYEKDVVGDKKLEIIVINNGSYYILSSEKCGRIIGWYNLESGKEIITLFNGFKNSGILNNFPITEEPAEVEVFGNKLIKFKSKNIEKLIRFTNKGIKANFETTTGTAVDIRNEITPDFADIIKTGNGNIVVESEGETKVRVYNKNSGVGIEFTGSVDSVIKGKSIINGAEIVVKTAENKGIVELTKIIAGKE